MTRKERKDIKNREKLIKKSRFRNSKFSKGIKVCRIWIGVVLMGCIGFLGIKWVSVGVEWKNGFWGISESLEEGYEQSEEEMTTMEEELTIEEPEITEDIITKQESDKMILRMNNLNRYDFSELAEKLNSTCKIYNKGIWSYYSKEIDTEDKTIESSIENEITINSETENTEYEKQYYINTSETDIEKIELIQNNDKLYSIIDESVFIDSWSSIIPDKGCIIIVAKVKDANSSEFKESIRDYINRLTNANEDNELYYIYNEYSELSYNNYNIICACDSKDEVVNLIVNYMVEQDEKAVSILE